jgi:hypothetical protein
VCEVKVKRAAKKKSANGLNVGHEWIEWKDASMGFWPVEPYDNILSTPGERRMPDPYEGQKASRTWTTKRNVRGWLSDLLFGQRKLVDGKGRGKSCKCATCEEIIDCMKRYSDRYDPKQNAAGVTYKLVSNNCRVFVAVVLRVCCLAKE